MITAIVQARMGSTRLPGKVLLPLAGRTMLAQQITRMKYCLGLGRIVVATTTGAEDDAIVDEARRLDVDVFRGSATDVLGRYASAARTFDAEVVVRITADCPLIQPEVVDRVVADLLQRSTAVDYVSNTHARTYPQGLDVEAMFGETLARMDRMATSAAAREHVTVFLRERPDLFVVGQTCDEEDNSHLRWTVDTLDDFAVVEQLYRDLELGGRVAPYQEMIRFARAFPARCNANAHIVQRPYWQVANHG
jgi:spore coat polysaccharide biosynthesis protein SpsF